MHLSISKQPTSYSVGPLTISADQVTLETRDDDAPRVYVTLTRDEVAKLLVQMEQEQAIDEADARMEANANRWRTGLANLKPPTGDSLVKQLANAWDAEGIDG